jgi:hypothetical protein
MLHRDEIVHAHSLADPDEPATKLRSADFLLEVMGRKERCRTKADAAIVLQRLRSAGASTFSTRDRCQCAEYGTQ